MATEQLTFTNNPISVLGTGFLAGEYSGTLTVNYDTGQVTGTITFSPVLGGLLPVFTADSFTLVNNGGNYTLTSPVDGLGLVLPFDKFVLNYSGQAPTTVDSAANTVLGAAILSGNGGAVTSVPVPCFVRGTLIASPNGERPVEELRIGDQVTTADGVAKEVIWVGTHSYDQAFIAKKFWPVRITAGALSDQLPKRDLLLSPCHAVLIDGLLIPSGELVNGVTITQDRPRDTVDYYHIELEEHDIVFAEGVSAETFVDDNSRMMFQNANEYYELYPDREEGDAVYSTMRVDDGEELEAIRQRIAARASVLKIAA